MCSVLRWWHRHPVCKRRRRGPGHPSTPTCCTSLMLHPRLPPPPFLLPPRHSLHCGRAQPPRRLAGPARGWRRHHGVDPPGVHLHRHLTRRRQPEAGRQLLQARVPLGIADVGQQHAAVAHGCRRRAPWEGSHELPDHRRLLRRVPSAQQQRGGNPHLCILRGHALELEHHLPWCTRQLPVASCQPALLTP